MLKRWLVPIGGIDSAQAKLDHTHAAVSAWLDADDHRDRTKPWVIAPLHTREGLCALERSTLSDVAETRLHDRVGPSTPIRIGAQCGSVLAEPQLMLATSFEELLDPTEADAWSVQFLTPTGFRRGTRVSPMPDPATVAMSLSRRWEDLGGPGNIRLDSRALSSLWISDIDGRNDVLPVGPVTFSGFVGRIRYACDGPNVAALFDTLVRFAVLAGLGSYTTRGMGLVRLEPTWSATAPTPPQRAARQR